LLPALFGQQKALAVENPRKFKRIYFYPGESIRFQTYDSKAKYQGRIVRVMDSTVVLAMKANFADAHGSGSETFRDYVPLKEIRLVYRRPTGSYGEYFRRMYAGTAMLSGSILITGTLVNSLVYERTPHLNSLFLAGSTLVSGLLVQALSRNKYRLNRNWRLRAMSGFN